MKVNVPETNMPRVVIVGGGFGGITLAKCLKKQRMQIVLVDKHNYHTFQPLLYQVATSGLEPDSIAFPLRKIFEGQPGLYFRMAEALSVDVERQQLETSIGAIDYDYLVLATGSATNFFGQETVERYAFGLKDIPEALNLRSMILQNFEKALLTTDLAERDALMEFVVVGGGPTGVELAGALGELKKHILPQDYPELDLRKMRIHLIEAGPTILGSMTSESSHNAGAYLNDLGVTVWCNTRVTGYDGRAVAMTGGKTLRSATLIWAAGVVGAPIEGIPAHAVASGRRIRVDGCNRVIGVDNVFAIGDVALCETEDYPYGHPMVAPAAIQQARLLAANLQRIHNGVELEEFRYVDKGQMATVGRNKAVAERGSMHIGGFWAWLAWMGLHLVFLMGFRNKLVVFVNWVWNYLSYDRGTRLIIRPFRRKTADVESQEEVINHG